MMYCFCFVLFRFVLFQVIKCRKVYKSIDFLSSILHISKICEYKFSSLNSIYSIVCSFYLGSNINLAFYYVSLKKREKSNCDSNFTRNDSI